MGAVLSKSRQSFDLSKLEVEQNSQENDKDQPVIFVTGIPGAGNRTATEKISLLTGYQTIYPGDLSRMRVNKGASKLCNKLKSSSEKETVKLIKCEMAKNKEAKGFVICGFPKSAKQSTKFMKEVKKPKKVIALMVDNAIASIRLEMKLSELGKSESEISQADNLVRSAVPKIRKLHESFDNGTLITINSSCTNMNTWDREIESATSSIVNLDEKEESKTTVALINYKMVDNN